MDAPVQRVCPPDTSFDAANRACLPDTECVEVVCVPGGDLYIALGSTSYFVFCAWQGDEVQPILLECPFNLVFSVQTMTCELCDQCGPGTTSTTTEATTTVTPRPPPIICASTGSYPDPTNCRGYLDCVFMAPPVVMSCPDGGTYDSVSESCRADAECIEIECQAPVYMSYAPDSPFFVWCSVDPETGVGYPVILKCPDGTVYDADAVTICVDRQPTTTTTAPEITTSDIQTTSTAVPEATTSDVQTTSTEAPEATTSDVQTTSTTVLEATTTEIQTTTTASENRFVCPSTGLFPDPTDCTIYQDCASIQSPIAVRCPFGYIYDANRKICDPLAECVEITCQLDGPTYMAYGINSPYFVWCSMDLALGIRVPILMECPTNLVFDDTILSCGGVSSTEGPTTTTPITTTTTTTTPTTTTSSTTSTAAATTTVEDLVTEPPNDFVCTYREYLPDPRDCTVFQDCSGATEAVLRTCAAGTIYNAAERRCMLASMTACVEVDCNSSDEIIMSYNGLNQYYIYCSLNPDSTKTPVVIKCPEGRVFDVTILQCRVV
jgi:Chitin binding Peritrophin-A domain